MIIFETRPVSLKEFYELHIYSSLFKKEKNNASSYIFRHIRLQTKLLEM